MFWVHPEFQLNLIIIATVGGSVALFQGKTGQNDHGWAHIKAKDPMNNFI